MLRRILGGIGLVAVLATGAKADTWFRVFQNGGGGGTNYDQFTGGVSNNQSGPFTPVFSIWCVDEKNEATNGDTYKVNITSLNGGDFSKTRNGVGSNAKYIQAAKIIERMHATNSTGMATANYQYAIWSVMHGKTGQECWSWDHSNPGSFTSSALLGNCDAPTVASIASASYGNIHLDEWRVITDIAAANVTYDPSSGVYQEFLSKCVSGVTHVDGYSASGGYSVGATLIQPPATCGGFDIPNDFTNTTPEPATMSLVALGLAGMAGATFRRRKK